VEGMITAREEIIPKLPADVKVIPGHGEVSSLDDVRTYVGMLKDTRAVVEGWDQARQNTGLTQAREGAREGGRSTRTT